MLIHRPRSMLSVWLALIVSLFLSLGGCATSGNDPSENSEGDLSLQNSAEQGTESESGEDSADFSEDAQDAQFEDQEFLEQDDFSENSLGEENNTFNTIENNNGSDLLGNEITNQENQLGAIIDEDSQLNSQNQEVLADNGLDNSENALVNGSEGDLLEAQTFGNGGLFTGISSGAAAQTLPEIGSKLVYVVVKGDTLAKISTMIYGSSSMWQKMAALSGIENPNLIFPGDLVYYQLTEAAVSFAEEYESMPKVALTTRETTSLQQIAQQQYGTQANWKHIWRQNAHIVNPFRLNKGTKVTLVAPEALARIQRNMAKRKSPAKLTDASFTVCHSPTLPKKVGYNQQQNR